MVRANIHFHYLFLLRSSMNTAEIYIIINYSGYLLTKSDIWEYNIFIHNLNTFTCLQTPCDCFINVTSQISFSWMWGGTVKEHMENCYLCNIPTFTVPCWLKVVIFQFFLWSQLAASVRKQRYRARTGRVSYSLKSQRPHFTFLLNFVRWHCKQIRSLSSFVFFTSHFA